MQEAVGLKVATDGEIRRAFWHYDLLQELVGLKLVERHVATGIHFKAASTRPVFPTIVGPSTSPQPIR